MKIGVTLRNMGEQSSPEVLLGGEVERLVCALRYESLDGYRDALAAHL